LYAANRAGCNLVTRTFRRAGRAEFGL